MIRHRPFGSGHPYAVDTEQRWPTKPIAGASVALGVRTSGDIREVVMHLDDGTGRVSEHPLERVVRSNRGRAEDGGHLASAQARRARAADGWRIDVAAPARAEWRYRFSAARGDGSAEATRWFTASSSTWAAAPDAVRVIGAHSRLVSGSTSVLRDAGRASRVRFALVLAPEERVTGFGERYDRLDHRASSLDSVVFEQYKSQGAERKTYLPMPFAHVLGGSGWGFHVRTSRRVWFDVGETDARLLSIEAEVDAAFSEGDPLLELAVYDGSATEVLHAFLGELGRPQELPPWVFRLWASSNEWNTQAEVERQVALHREHGIPVGSVVIEAWSDESTFTAFRDAQYKVRDDGGPLRLDDYSFPADGAWPDPRAMTDSLHAEDIRLVLWQIPLLKMRPHPRGQLAADVRAALREGVLVQETAPDGTLRPYRNRGWWFPLSLMPDLTDDRSARWWTDKRRYLVEEVGVDGFKTDGGEHAWGSDLVYLDGTRGDEGNSRFPVAYAAAYGELLRSAGKAPVTFSRAGFTGSQSHGAFWAGDENSTWDAFRWSLNAGLSAAACGIVYWGWDIAGFSGPIPTAELYLRALAASTFVPVMQYHSEFNAHRVPSNDRTPWNIAEQTGDDRVLPVTRRFVALREAMLPYLTEQAAKTVRTSSPLMRALYFDYPDDPKIWDRPQQWLLGDDLLVAPVTAEGAQTWTVYLPQGEWIDVWTGKSHSGGQSLDRAVPIDEIPVYARSEAWPRLEAAFAEGAGQDPEARDDA